MPVVHSLALSRTARLPILIGGVAAVALACLPARTAHAKACPNIMLVLDQSKSMEEDVEGHRMDDPAFTPPSKWELLQQVVVDVVREYGDRVPFGLELYSSDSYCKPPCITGSGDADVNDMQCFDATKIDVSVSAASAGDIIAKLRAAMPFAETNTGEAIKRAAQDMSLLQKKEKYIILVTDGNPTCNSGDKGQNEGAFTVSEITKAAVAANKGGPDIKTFVVGFEGAGVNPSILDKMAYYGGKQTMTGCGSSLMPPVPCYYRAGVNAKEFKDQLDKIVRDLGGGEFGGLLCDDSCYSQGCPNGQVCVTDEINPAPHCVPDTCGGRSCGNGEYCKAGACVKACTDGCPAGQRCEGGKCASDKCAGKMCGEGKVCKPSTGDCVDSPCAKCLLGGICNPETGRCEADQCWSTPSHKPLVTCPGGTVCTFNGNCTAGDNGKKEGGGGCSVASPARTARDPLGLGAIALALVAAAMMLRRRR